MDLVGGGSMVSFIWNLSWFVTAELLGWLVIIEIGCLYYNIINGVMKSHPSRRLLKFDYRFDSEYEISTVLFCCLEQLSIRTKTKLSLPFRNPCPGFVAIDSRVR